MSINNIHDIHGILPLTDVYSLMLYCYVYVNYLVTLVPFKVPCEVFAVHFVIVSFIIIIIAI